MNKIAYPRIHAWAALGASPPETLVADAYLQSVVLVTVANGAPQKAAVTVGAAP